MSASIDVQLGLDTTPFAAAFGRVRGLIAGAGARLSGLLPVALGVGAAAFAGAAFKRALDLGGELNDLSAQTGVAAGELMVLQQAFQNSGMAAEDVGSTINKMQRAIVAGSGVFARLGVDLASLRGQSARDQLRTIGEAINAIDDPAERAAAAMEVFGKSGGRMLGLFSDSGALDSAAEQVGTQAEIMNRNAALFDDVSDKLALAGRKTMGFFVGVADKVVPVLAPLLDGFASIDLAKYGQAIGSGIAFVVQSIGDGTLAALLFDAARIAFGEAVNLLGAALAGIGSGFGQLLVENARNVIELFRILTTADFWSGVGKAWIGIAQSFQAALLDGIANVLESLKQVPLIGEKIGSGVENLREKAAGIRERGAENRAAAGEAFAPAISRAKGRVRDTFENVSEATTEGAKKGDGIVDTGTWQKKFGDNINRVFSNAENAGKAAREKVKGKPGKGGGRYGEEDRDPVSSPKSKQAFADSDRRVGLGGRAGGNSWGGSDKSKPAEATAMQKMSNKLDKTNTLLEKLLAATSGKNESRIRPVETAAPVLR